MAPRTGDLLARKYRLGAELGRGAMGIVYAARHETLDQPVAIKLLRRTDDGDEQAATRRFEREARIVAKLDSAHVVKVIDVDRTGDGVPYLVMELLQGRDLAAELEARAGLAVPIAESVGWMLQVCEAMQVAHDAGVVHRDLKLSNVFLTREGTVKVLDFGVAVFRPGDPERSVTTSVAGTPRYMAPEQLLGEPPDPSSDVWAIGVMLYRVLGDRFPYDTPTMAAQMLAMMDGCPPLDEVAPRVSPELARVVARALGRTLEERWPSASALAQALAPFAEARAGATRAGTSAPPPADPPVPSSRSPHTSLRGGRTLLLLATAAILLAASAYALRRPPASPRAAPAAPASAPATPTPLPSAAATPLPTPAAIALPSAAATPLPSPTSVPRLTAPTHAPAPPARATAPPPLSPDDGFPPHL